MAHMTPTVRRYWAGGTERAELEEATVMAGAIRLDTPAWRSWLEAPTSTRFAYPLYDLQAGWMVGLMTVRKERRARGGSYWVAYRRTGGRLRKIYLGRSEQVTGQRLATVAARLLAMAGVASSPLPEGGDAPHT